MDIEEIKEKVKNCLSDKRYNHSIGAMKAAGELAKIYGENQEEARLAGLLHDIAKESIKNTEKNKIFNFLNKHNMPADEIEKDNIGLLHAKMGAIIAKEEFGVSKKVQNAIKYHTTGNVNMDLFATIIYLADKIEENRSYEGVEEMRELAKNGEIDKAILITLDFTIKRSIDKRITIHPDTIDLRNFLLKILDS